MKQRKWPTRDQAHFLQRTGELLKRGYPLAEAIESTAYYLPESRKEEIGHCLDDLKEGYPLYQILANLQFNKTLIGYVYFAEQHGGLAEAFLDGSNMLLKRDKDIQRFGKLLFYPAILIFITSVLFIFVENILLPKFTSLFKTMQLKPNFFTKVVYFFGSMSPLLVSALFFIFICMLIYYFLIFRKLSPLKQTKQVVRVPIIGSVFKLLYTHYFSVQLSYLLTGGLSVIDALQLFEKNTGLPFYMQVGREIKIKLTSGERLETILASFPFFEKELSRIVKHGQENGKLGQELYFYSSYCLTVLEEKTEKWMKIIQPVLYLIIGLLVVSMYLAVLLPMFHLLDGI